MVSIWFLISCLEKVTGEDIPLDPRFSNGGAAQPDGTPNAAPQPSGSPSSAEGQPPSAQGEATPAPPAGDGLPTGPNPAGELPYQDVTGEKIIVTGKVLADSPAPIRIDICEADASAQGGIRRVGAVNLPAGPGEFSFQVPVAVSALTLQAFQDPDKDGPSEKDPFAELALSLSGSAPAPLELKLEVGARGRAAGNPQPQEGPAPGGDGIQFPEGPKVPLSGEVLGATGTVVVDVFRLDSNSGAGRSYLGKIRPLDGKFSVEFPVNYGPIELEAYQDLTGDSRTSDDIAAAYSGNPVTIATEPVTGISIRFP